MCGLSYPARKAHALYYIVICDLSGCTIFSSHLKRQDFRKKKKVAEHKMCLWRFSIQILYETFLILRRIQRDIIINVQRSSCRVPVILIRFSGQTFEIHRYAPHYDVSVNDGPHIRRWSHKIMIL